MSDGEEESRITELLEGCSLLLTHGYDDGAKLLFRAVLPSLITSVEVSKKSITRKKLERYQRALSTSSLLLDSQAITLRERRRLESHLLPELRRFVHEVYRPRPEEASVRRASQYSRRTLIVVIVVAVLISGALLIVGGQGWGYLGYGLRGEYFRGPNFQEVVFEQIDPTIDFKWLSGSPSPYLPPGKFSVRWRGSIRITTAGRHRFVVTSDDGVRVWVNKTLIIDDWNIHSKQSTVGEVELPPGSYPIQIEYFDAGGEALLEMRWRLAEMRTDEVIPPRYLSPATQENQ